MENTKYRISPFLEPVQISHPVLAEPPDCLPPAPLPASLVNDPLDVVETGEQGVERRGVEVLPQALDQHE